MPPYPPGTYPGQPGYGAFGGYPQPPPYATWGRRVGGWLIDWLIVWAVELVIGLPLRAFFTTRGFNASTGLRQTMFHVHPWFGLVGALIAITYGTLLCGSERGQTVGMMAINVRAVNADTGQRIGYGMALWRAVFEYVMFVLFVIPWVIDMLWPLWDDRNQTLHDKVSNTVVVLKS